MRQLRAMMKKELFEQLKTHRLVVMLLLFTLVGVLSPAFAKMTPWLLDLVSGDMAETGIQIGNLEVTSLSSWTQYYKKLCRSFFLLSDFIRRYPDFRIPAWNTDYSSVQRIETPHILLPNTLPCF